MKQRTNLQIVLAIVVVFAIVIVLSLAVSRWATTLILLPFCWWLGNQTVPRTKRADKTRSR